MKLYLVRHGDTHSSTLSNLGQKQVQQIALLLKPCALNVSAVYHSGKMRAKQSADILCQELHLPNSQRLDGLNPNDPIEPIIDEIISDNVMLVGHLPFMERMVHHLVGSCPIPFEPATIVCIEKSIIQWVLSPKLWSEYD